MIEASAPAKVILVGEHAVVYGQPAIAVPIASLRASATAEPGAPGQGLKIVAADLNQTLPLNVDAGLVDHALLKTARLVSETHRRPLPDLTITLRSQIPMASGLGSGAAVSAALARALSAALGEPLELERLNALVYEVEKMHHGTPSGIDNTVVVYDQPIFYVRGQPIERLTIAAPFTLLIGDTGQSALTRIAVGDVRALVEREPERYLPVLSQIGALVREARAAVERGDAATLGERMTQNHALLQTLAVSSPELDRLVHAALDAGVLGAKLSGGGRGGNMIALVVPETVARMRQALERAGAVHVFETTVQ